MYQELKRTCTAIVLLLKPFNLFSDVAVAIAVVVFLNSLMIKGMRGLLCSSI